MKKTLFLLAAATLVLSFASNGAKAAPAAPGVVRDAPHVILVAEGCGRGWHRGPYGGCQRNLGPAWPCWWVRGPFGRWRLVCH